MFAIGDTVHTSMANPAGHHRLPRYLRGIIGRIHAIRGGYPLANLRATGIASPDEMLYTVCFAARDVWGADAEPATAIFADLWESYLVAG